MIDFSSILASQIDQKSTKNQSTNHPNNTRTKNKISRFCIVIYNTFVPSAMLCCVQNSTKNDTEILSKTALKSTPNLDRFCTQLGSILGGFWRSRWSQIRSKMPSRCNLFFILFLTSFFIDFYPNLVPTWPQLGPNLAPKSTPKPTQEPSKIDPKSHLIFDLFFDRFFINFASIFDPKRASFSLIFDRFFD